MPDVALARKRVARHAHVAAQPVRRAVADVSLFPELLKTAARRFEHVLIERGAKDALRRDFSTGGRTDEDGVPLARVELHAFRIARDAVTRGERFVLLQLEQEAAAVPVPRMAWRLAAHVRRVVSLVPDAPRVAVAASANSPDFDVLAERVLCVECAVWRAVNLDKAVRLVGEPDAFLRVVRVEFDAQRPPSAIGDRRGERRAVSRVVRDGERRGVKRRELAHQVGAVVPADRDLVALVRPLRKPANVHEDAARAIER